MSAILSLLSLLAFSQAASLEQYFDPRIVNGEDAKLGEIPYIVSLQYKSSSEHFGGGSILNSNYVITTTSRVVGMNPANIKVIAGTINLKDPKSTHDVEAIIVHKSHNIITDYYRYDIALVKVKNPFVESDTLRYVTLPPKDLIVKANESAIISGWGRDRKGALISDKLKRTNVFITDFDYCKEVHNKMGRKIYDSQICAKDPKAKKGPCWSDAGGPLTVQGKLVGLILWGSCDMNYLHIYTRVSSYIDWIQDNAV